jgi:hypothetical protein
MITLFNQGTGPEPIRTGTLANLWKIYLKRNFNSNFKELEQKYFVI